MPLVDEETLYAELAEAVRGLGERAHWRWAPDGTEIWLTDEQDESAIAAPLARIAVRHMPAGPELANPDLGDALAAAFAVVNYLRKQWRRLAAWRREQAAQVVDDVGGETDAA